MILSFTAIVMTVYVLVIRPQRELVMLILTAASELLLVFFHLFSLVFLDKNMPAKKKTDYGFVMLALVGIYVLANWAVVATLMTIDLRAKCKNRRSMKETIKAEKLK